MSLAKLAPTLLTFGLLSTQSPAGQDASSLKGFECYALDAYTCHRATSSQEKDYLRYSTRPALERRKSASKVRSCMLPGR